MPRAARFRTASIGELFRQLRYAPAETRTRQMHAAEELLAEIDADRTYPEDFIVYRVTGYRPDGADAGTMLVGAALIPDLVNLIQRLSEKLHLPPRRADARARVLDDVARELNVSVKTLRRYHQQGLVFHFVDFGDERPKLACFDDALAQFIDSHRDRVDRAAQFSRVDEDLERTMISEARAMREQSNVSLNEAAQRIASKHERAHETVRMLLQRHERAGSEPIFREHGPLSDRDQRLAYRAWRRGVPIADIAARFGKTGATVRRAVRRQRGRLLASVRPAHLELPTFALDDAESIILSRPEARTNLDALLPTDDALALIDAAHAAAPLEESVESALVAAMHFLHQRAARAIDALPTWPGASELDQIETDLRWAGMLRRRLVSAGLPAALRAMEQHFGRDLTTLPADRIRAELRRAAIIVSDVVSSLNPSRGHRLDPRTRLAAAKALARDAAPAHAPGRAAARHAAGTLRVDELFDQLSPWEVKLDLPRLWRGRVDALAARERDLMVRRYGLNGDAPQTIAALATSKNMTDSATARALGKARASLRALARRS